MLHIHTEVRGQLCGAGSRDRTQVVRFAQHVLSPISPAYVLPFSMKTNNVCLSLVLILRGEHTSLNSTHRPAAICLIQRNAIDDLIDTNPFYFSYYFESLSTLSGLNSVLVDTLCIYFCSAHRALMLCSFMALQHSTEWIYHNLLNSLGKQHKEVVRVWALHNFQGHSALPHSL